jgi:hypothetical protein
MSRVLTVTQVSKVHVPVFLPAGSVYDQRLVVFCWDDPGHLALLTSDLHRAWVLNYGSTLESRPVYTPTDVFGTYPQPGITSRMDFAGEALDAHRRPIMIERQIGLTALYSQVHGNELGDPDIARLREIHSEIDRSVAEAYGWDDISLDHGFHDTAQGVRFTISASARREVLKRLLELNHQRHAKEEARGLTGAKGRRTAGKKGGAVQTPLFGL